MSSYKVKLQTTDNKLIEVDYDVDNALFEVIQTENEVDYSSTNITIGFMENDEIVYKANFDVISNLPFKIGDKVNIIQSDGFLD